MIFSGTGKIGARIMPESTSCSAPIAAAHVSRPKLETVAGPVRRAEERKAVDVVDVGVGQEKMRFQPRIAVQVGAENSEPGAGIQDQALAGAHDLDAGSVAAVAQGVRARARHRAAYPPESDPEVWPCGHGR